MHNKNVGIIQDTQRQSLHKNNNKQLQFISKSSDRSNVKSFNDNLTIAYNYSSRTESMEDKEDLLVGKSG